MPYIIVIGEEVQAGEVNSDTLVGKPGTMRPIHQLKVEVLDLPRVVAAVLGMPAPRTRKPPAPTGPRPRGRPRKAFADSAPMADHPFDPMPGAKDVCAVENCLVGPELHPAKELSRR